MLVPSMFNPPKRANGCTAVTVTSFPCFLWNATVGCDIHVAYAVAVGHAEFGFTLKILGDPLEAPAGAGVIARVDKGHAPRLRDALMHLHAVLIHVESDVGHVEEVVGEILLDEVALVPAANDKVVDPVLRVDFKDVPEDRSAADFDHGFGANSRFFAEPRAQARPPR